MLQKHHDQNKVTSLVAGRQKDCVEDVDHAVPVSGGTTGRKSLDWFQARCNWETPGNPLGGQTMRSLAGVLSVMFMAAMAVGQTTEAKPPKLYNAALTELGASAKGTGAPFNRDWPANGALAAGEGRGGTIFGAPMTGGRVDIHLIIPVDVKAVEVIQLKYYNTQIPKAIDIFVEGKLVKHVELANKPNEAQRVELETRGQNVGILVTDVYPPSTYTDDTGKPRVVNFGGWSRLRVLTTTNMADLVKRRSSTMCRWWRRTSLPPAAAWSKARSKCPGGLGRAGDIPAPCGTRKTSPTTRKCSRRARSFKRSSQP